MIKLPVDLNVEERRVQATELFKEGYNCCQSVVLTFADILEANNLSTRELLTTIASGFGGGMGRLREVCGAFSGTVMMASFICPAVDKTDKKTKMENYALVQEFAAQFREANGGSIVCRELLGLPPGVMEKPEPSDRTAQYYQKRPCAEMVGNAAAIVAQKLIVQAK